MTPSSLQISILPGHETSTVVQLIDIAGSTPGTIIEVSGSPILKSLIETDAGFSAEAYSIVTICSPTNLWSGMEIRSEESPSSGKPIVSRLYISPSEITLTLRFALPL